MTTGYEAGFYRDIEVIRRYVNETLPDIRDALLLLATERADGVPEVEQLRGQLYDGILKRHGVRKVER